MPKRKLLAKNKQIKKQLLQEDTSVAKIVIDDIFDVSSVKQTNRMENYEKVHEIFKGYDVMTGELQCARNNNFEDGSSSLQTLSENNYILPSIISIEGYIGSGSWGYVSVIHLNDFPELKMVLKESKTEKVKALDFANHDDREIVFLQKMQEVIKKGICGNFPLLYFFTICPTCVLRLKSKTSRNKNCQLIFTELANGDLCELWEYSVTEVPEKSAEVTEDIVYNAYFQILYSVLVLHLTLGIIHTDIKKPNILYKKIPKGGYWLYIIDNRKYYLPNLGFQLYLNDFGVSMSTFSRRALATPAHRNTICRLNSEKTDLVSVDKNELRTNYSNEMSEAEWIKKGYISTQYALDLYDVVNMFIGGSRGFQAGQHKSLIQDMSLVKNWSAKLELMDYHLSEVSLSDFKEVFYPNFDLVSAFPILIYGRKIRNMSQLSAYSHLEYMYRDMYTTTAPKSSQIIDTFIFKTAASK
jgi:serine/threonine protein kinase